MMFFGWIVTLFSLVSSESVYELVPTEVYESNLQPTDFDTQNSIKFDEKGNNYSNDHNFDEAYNDYDDFVGVQGVPGVDFPNYAQIPETKFSCAGKIQPGYYGDVEAQCQVFHICLPGGHKTSFLCPNGSLFNQMFSVCDWWYDVNCDSTVDILESLKDILKVKSHAFKNYEYDDDSDPYFFVAKPVDHDLHLESSGGNAAANKKVFYDINTSKKQNDFKDINFQNARNDYNINKYSENNEFTRQQNSRSHTNDENHTDDKTNNLNHIDTKKSTRRYGKNSTTKQNGKETSMQEQNKMLHIQFNDKENNLNKEAPLSKNNDRNLNYVNLLKSPEIVPSKRLENGRKSKPDIDKVEAGKASTVTNEIKKYNENEDENFQGLHSFDYKSDVSDLRNSQNEAYYGGSVQNTFNRNY